MTNETIEKCIDIRSRNQSAVNIHFIEKSTVKGLFVRAAGYDELKYKDLWELFIMKKMEEWNKTKNMYPSRIFNWPVIHPTIKTDHC